TATVTAVAGPTPGTPTGTVMFEEGMTPLGTATLNANGVATFATTTPLSAGTHSIMAVYSGDSNFAASTSTAITQTVNQAATTTTLTSSANPALFSQPLTLTATVTAVAPGMGVPTGTVDFVIRSGGIGSAMLDSNGRAALQIPAAGSTVTGPITATYRGSSN